MKFFLFFFKLFFTSAHQNNLKIYKQIILSKNKCIKIILFGNVLFLIQLFFNVTNIDRLSEINFVL